MNLKYQRNIAFLSTYAPRQCGLATFTQNLIKELDKRESLSSPKVIAISDGHYDYDKRVIMQIKQYDRSSYIKVARDINASDIELLVIEHEYGIFGGEAGEYIVDFILELKIPFIITLHTVLPIPTRKQKNILKILGNKSEKVIIMAHNSKSVLQDIYDIDSSKVTVIHHGVPNQKILSRTQLKKAYGLEEKNVISTFGLLSPGKGLEYAIKAISEAVRWNPDIVYLILGKTHPSVKRDFGEKYREKLTRMVQEFDIKKNIIFVDKYLSENEIIRYIEMSDIYMTPYLGKEQAVSGTLAYAVGYGRVIVSTPYPYAMEMLAEGRGMLAEFRNAGSLAENINFILDNPEEKSQMEKRTLQLGKTMMWEHVAGQYEAVFNEIITSRRNEDSYENEINWQFV